MPTYEEKTGRSDANESCTGSSKTRSLSNEHENNARRIDRVEREKGELDEPVVLTLFYKCIATGRIYETRQWQGIEQMNDERLLGNTNVHAMDFAWQMSEGLMTYEEDGAEKEKVVLDEFHVGIVERSRGNEYRCALTSSRFSSYAVALCLKHQANKERNTASMEHIYMSSRRRGENKRERERERETSVSESCCVFLISYCVLSRFL